MITMPRPRSLGFVLALVVLLATGGLILGLQFQETCALESHVALMRIDATDLAHVRAENERLRSQQLPADKLASLRADHAAVVRLRTELESLRK